MAPDTPIPSHTETPTSDAPAPPQRDMNTPGWSNSHPSPTKPSEAPNTAPTPPPAEPVPPPPPVPKP